MPIDKNEITKEMIEKAMECKTAEELLALAKTDYELDSDEIEKIAGGLCVTKTTAGCRPHGKRGY